MASERDRNSGRRSKRPEGSWKGTDSDKKEKGQSAKAHSNQIKSKNDVAQQQGSTNLDPQHPAPILSKSINRDGGVEEKIYGLNACRALFKYRPESIIKVYLSKKVSPELADILKWCASQKRGYEFLPDGDLRRLASSEHHEGIVMRVIEKRSSSLSALIEKSVDRQVCYFFLDAIANPHNLGAIIRNAAFLGINGVVIAGNTFVRIPPASFRVAEGGAEIVPVVFEKDSVSALKLLSNRGFSIIAATPEVESQSIYEMTLPKRTVFVFGEEQKGVSEQVRNIVSTNVRIPGTGKIDSLNVASATAVFASEWLRRTSSR